MLDELFLEVHRLGPYELSPIVTKESGNMSANQICGACGKPWDGEECGHAENGWLFAVCYPTEGPDETVVADNQSKVIKIPYPITTHKEIAAAMRRIEKERLNALQELMRDFDKNYYSPNVRTLREACGRLGHKWRFTGLGPFGDPWFSCGICYVSECRRETDNTSVDTSTRDE